MFFMALRSDTMWHRTRDSHHHIARGIMHYSEGECFETSLSLPAMCQCFLGILTVSCNRRSNKFLRVSSYISVGRCEG